MATSSSVVAVRWGVLALVLGLVGYFAWGGMQADPEDATAEERIVYPQPAYTPEGAEPTAVPTPVETPAQTEQSPPDSADGDSAGPSASASPSTGDDVDALPDHLLGDAPIRVTGVVGAYSAAPGPVRTLVRLTQRNGYLRGTDADFRIKHAVITCERVVHQNWTWDQQVPADVANGVNQQAAQEFADLLEREFCPALGL